MRALFAFVLATLPAAIAGAQGAHTGGAHTGGAHTGGAHTGGGAPVDAFATEYTEASRAWHSGQYEEALARFRALYDSSHRAELLYDIGVTCDRLDRRDEAIDAFRRYIEALPMAHNRLEVEQRIASLEHDRDAVAASPGVATSVAPRDRALMTLMGSETAAAPVAPVTDVGTGPTWTWSWPLLALTLATAIATPIAWDQGWQALERLRLDCTEIGGCFDSEIDGSDAKHWEIATNVFLVSTIVLGAATLIAFLAEGLSTPEPEQQAALRFDVGLGGASVSGSF